MKSLHTLIRLQRQKVDELKRKTVALENQKHVLTAKMDALAGELRRELELASATAEMGGFFGDFAERIRGRRAELEQEVRKLDKQIDDLSTQLRTVFGELKKYEIVLERRRAEAHAKEAKEENSQLDEIALQQHARKGDE